MAEIVFTAYWESAVGVPMTSPATAPNIRIRRLDTNALVVTDQVMTAVGDGLFKYEYTAAVIGIEYVARADGDPIAAGQSTQRYVAGSGDTKVPEIFTRLGLEIGNAITDTTAGIDSGSGDIEITRTGDGETTSTLTRQA